MIRKNLPTPPSGRGSVQTGLGRPGGPAFGPYGRIPERTSGPADFALPAAVAGHNDPQQSIPQRRPTQDQPRDRAMGYMAPRADVPAVTGTPSGPARETAMGRPGGPRAVGPPIRPLTAAPPAGGVATDHTGRQPYAGREPVMARMSGPAIGVTADSETNPGVGGLEIGRDGPVMASGNFRGAFDARGDQTGSAASEGLRTRDAVRALVQANGGRPADTESARGRTVAGGLRTSFESHDAGPEGGVGVYGPGQARGEGFESHDGRGMANR